MEGTSEDGTEVQDRPLDERMAWVFDMAERHSSAYSSPEASMARQRYQAQHPTSILALECMDGRVNMAVATGTPTGVIQPFRQLGSMFDLGWPHFVDELSNAVSQATAQGRKTLVLITYHYSRSDPNHGCAGFGCITENARRHSFQIKAQIEKVFGESHETVYPVVVGYETDEDGLTLHGTGVKAKANDELNVADMVSAHYDQASHLDRCHAAARAALTYRLTTMFPDMPTQVREDLLPILSGNLRRIATVRRNAAGASGAIPDAKSPLLPPEHGADHREWVLCIGPGVDWLHTPNVALTIGPYCPDLLDPIRKAAGILTKNLKAGRIPPDGVLLMGSASYKEPGMDRARAVLKAWAMRRFAAKVIREEFPELSSVLQERTVVLSQRTWALERLD